MYATPVFHSTLRTPKGGALCRTEIASVLTGDKLMSKLSAKTVAAGQQGSRQMQRCSHRAPLRASSHTPTAASYPLLALCMQSEKPGTLKLIGCGVP